MIISQGGLPRLRGALQAALGETELLAGLADALPDLTLIPAARWSELQGESVPDGALILRELGEPLVPGWHPLWKVGVPVRLGPLASLLALQGGWPVITGEQQGERLSWLLLGSAQGGMDEADPRIQSPQGDPVDDGENHVKIWRSAQDLTTGCGLARPGQASGLDTLVMGVMYAAAAQSIALMMMLELGLQQAGDAGEQASWEEASAKLLGAWSSEDQDRNGQTLLILLGEALKADLMAAFVPAELTGLLPQPPKPGKGLGWANPERLNLGDDARHWAERVDPAEEVAPSDDHPAGGGPLQDSQIGWWSLGELTDQIREEAEQAGPARKDIGSLGAEVLAHLRGQRPAGQEGRRQLQLSALELDDAEGWSLAAREDDWDDEAEERGEDWNPPQAPERLFLDAQAIVWSLEAAGGQRRCICVSLTRGPHAGLGSSQHDWLRGVSSEMIVSVAKGARPIGLNWQVWKSFTAGEELSLGTLGGG